MNREMVRRILKDPDMTPSDKLVGVVIYDRSIYGYCWLDKKTIAFEAGVTPKTVSRAIGRLKKRHYIEQKSYAAGDVLPTNRTAKHPRTLFRAVDKLSYCGDKLSAPCRVLRSVGNKSMNGRESKKDLATKSNRFTALWQLFHTVKFCTKNGHMSTVMDNVAMPEPVCAVLSGPIYKEVDLERSMHDAAAWTCEHKRNRRDRLGAFLRNWFTKAAEKQTPTQQPRYFENL